MTTANPIDLDAYVRCPDCDWWGKAKDAALEADNIPRCPLCGIPVVKTK